MLESLTRLDLPRLVEGIERARHGDGEAIVAEGEAGDAMYVIAEGQAEVTQGGRHLRYPKDTPLTNLYLTMLDKLKVPVENLGDSTGKLELLSIA